MSVSVCPSVFWEVVLSCHLSMSFQQILLFLPLVCFWNAGIIDGSPHLTFLCGFLGLNSELQAYAANAFTCGDISPAL